MPGSSDFINYSVRPNKSVERKLIVETLSSVSGVLNLHDYRYLGMGAMWFVDFLMVHRFLHIRDMLSMEKINPQRADFNRPLSCIEIVPGESTTLLKDQKLPIKDKRLLVWLDYDGILTESELTDLRLLFLGAQMGSIIMVTVNASKRPYLRRDEKDQPLSIEESVTRTFGNLVPQPFPKYADTRRGFQELIAAILWNHMEHEVVQGRAPLEVMPLFNFGYEDGAPMVTVGGILCDAGLREKLAQSQLMKFHHVGRKHTYINVPPLTFREKLAMDTLLPRMEAEFKLHNPEDQGEQAEIEKTLAAELKLNLKADQISDYAKFYRHYPVFWDAST